MTVATPVKFYDASRDERTQVREMGEPVTLACDVTNPDVRVFWYRADEQIFNQPGIDLREARHRRTPVIRLAKLAHSGVYSRRTADDAATFWVEVKGDWLARRRFYRRVFGGKFCKLCSSLLKPDSKGLSLPLNRLSQTIFHKTQ